MTPGLFRAVTRSILAVPSPSPKESPTMSTEQNKTVVRRFITEVLQGGDLDVLDVVLAPDYVNPAMGDADRAGFRAILSQLRGGAAMHIDDLELVAEGGGGVARLRL